jgi:putative phosphoribosyl transferase
VPLPHVEVADLRLPGDIDGVEGATGIVVFAHGSGSSHASPRNRAVAGRLNEAGLATLLFDLLTVDEAGDRALVFDIALLATRLSDATRWVRAQPGCGSLPIGYYGASTGSAAALTAASSFGDDVSAVVSRGGRPDLASGLERVTAPTLLIVGGADSVVLELNREAERELRCTHRLEVVPRATHLFEEPGAMDRVTALAEAWFVQHLR